MKVVVIIVGILCSLISTNAVRAEEKIPVFAREYLARYLSQYSYPKGKLYPYMREVLEKEGKSTEPWSITGDFNGDGVVDWAGILVGTDKKMDALVVFSKSNDYDHKLLFKSVATDSESMGVGIYIEPPGTVHGFPLDNVPEEDLIAHLKHPGIHIVFFEKSSVLYYWKDGKIAELWTSD